jgi:hypothetical protein
MQACQPANDDQSGLLRADMLPGKLSLPRYSQTFLMI